MSECIFPNHLRWQYSNAADVDDVGLLCLKLFHKLLSPLTESPATRCWLKLCLESLLMSKSSPTLLDVATTGKLVILFVEVEIEPETYNTQMHSVVLVAHKYSLKNK